MRWPWSRRREFHDIVGVKALDSLVWAARAVSGTRVSRGDALSVPAVRRGRNLICSVAAMPLELVRDDHRVLRSPLLDQLDPDVPNVVTLAQTVEDLLFESIAWWLVTARDFVGYPIAVRRLDPGAVSLHPPVNANTGRPAPLPSDIDPRGAVVWVDGRAVPGSSVIRFDSPNPAVLAHAGREIRRAILLDQAASVYAEDPRPADYFSPADGADPIDDAEVLAILDKWRAARKSRGTGWVPASMAYHAVDSPSPQQLQLVELSKQASLDIANALGIDPEDLGLSTTSRTYSNDVDRRRNRLNDVLAPYMRAVTHRLTMGDVTRRGHRVRFNPTEYLQPNPTDRWGVYAVAVGMGAMTIPEVRDAEGMPELPPMPPPPPPPPPPPAEGAAEEAPQEDTPDMIDAARPAAHAFALPPSHTFDAGPQDRGLTFVDVPVETFSVDTQRRIIEGVALPYDRVATKWGQSFRFERGSLVWDAAQVGRVKLLRDHDMRQAIGAAVELTDTPRGLRARFKVARGAEGDRALELAEDGVLDGFSVGVDFDAAVDTVPDPKYKGALLVRRADLRETSLTAMPSFDDARVTKVAASRDQETQTTMPCGTCGQVHADGVCPASDTTTTTDAPAPGLVLNDDQRRSFVDAMLAQPGALDRLLPSSTPAEPEPNAGAGVTLSADQLVALVQSGRLSLTPPAPEPERPEVVDPTRGGAPGGSGVSFIAEALPYAFDRRGPQGGTFAAAEHDFSTDLHEMALMNDHRGEHSEAGKRVMSFLRKAFADVDSADVTTLNPSIQRPDMFVDQRDYRYPIWNAINRGSPPNGIQPFIFPKFSSATGLVGDHTQGVEPTGGTYVATSQTVTPTALSGKASITREVWDMGGNPAVSTLIYNQMLRGWREGLEAAAATFLNTLTAAADIALGVAVVDVALATAWDQALAGLQFVRGYDFEMFAVEQVLYKAFVDAADSTGRPLFPILNATNANGQAQTRFRALDLSGVVGSPSWALPSTPGAVNNSWLFDPSVVWGWASPPERLEFPGSGGAAAGPDYKPVAFVDLAIWGYKAFANSDIEGVRQVTYDSVV